MEKVVKDISLKLMFNTEKRMRIKKVEKLVANLLDQSEYVVHMRNLKQNSNHDLVLKKVHRVIKFNPNFLTKTIY